MEKYGTTLLTSGENIAYSDSMTAMKCVLQLIVDDGVEGRGHRTNIFNPEFNVIGIHIGQHKKYPYICVMDFAGGFAEKGKTSPIQEQFDKFMKEPHDFDIPEGTTLVKTGMKGSVKGKMMTKIMVKTVRKADGSTMEVKKEFTGAVSI